MPTDTAPQPTDTTKPAPAPQPPGTAVDATGKVQQPTRSGNHLPEHLR